MADPIFLDAYLVRTQIERMKVEFPDLLSDAELLANMIEGETDFNTIVERVVDRILDADSTVDAIEIRAANLRTRKARFERKSEAYRSVVLGLMEAAGLKKHQLPETTLSMSNRTRVVVYDVDALPQGTFALKRVPAAAAALRAMIEADGEEIPGVRIEASPAALTVRTR